MTPIVCAKEVAALIKEKFVGYKADDDKVAGNGITIKDGYLPMATTNEEKAKQCPYIIVRPATIIDDPDDQDQESKVDFQIIISTYNSDKNDGHLELYDLIETVRQTLLTNTIVGECFELQTPIKTHIIEAQPYPVWVAYIELSYLVPTPSEELIENE